MTTLGTESNPLRVAIVGAGPAGFYAAEHLNKQKDLVVQIDMFDRLPTPYGLVRNGVAPDHQKIKSVTKVFERTALKTGFRFFGYVELGTDITVEDLKNYYHQIIFTTGAETDRMLNIPGIELMGSRTATEFVAWYNGHPDYRDYEFDLSKESVAVVGVGNVAVDVCRILCRTPEELAETDIADYALEALRKSNVKDVYMLGRRGVAQAAFTAPEVKELGELEGADIVVHEDEVELGPLSEAALAEADRGTARKVEIVQSYAGRPLSGKPRRLHLRFLVSPTELLPDDEGGIRAMKLVKNELYATDAGTLRPRATDRFEEVPVQLVFRSIGYQGVPLPGVPFNKSWNVIQNEAGRVCDVENNEQVVGLYTAGWIKRGPSGVIGTNKPDSVETVDNMLADLAEGKVNHPAHPEAAAIEALLQERKPEYFSFADWQKLDALETAAGEAEGRPRVKFTSIEAMLEARDNG